MAVRPLPVIMIVAHAAGRETTIRALELGAVDFFLKPSSLDQLEAARRRS